MKLALVGPAYPLRGGIAQYTNALYERLRPAHEVLLIRFSRQYPSLLFPGRTQLAPETPGVSPVGEALLDSVSVSSWRRTADRLIEFAPDGVVFQWWHPFFGIAYGSIVRRVVRERGSSIIFLCHNVYSHERGGFPGRRRLETRLIRHAFRRVDGFLIQSRGLEEQVRSFRPDARVEHVHHPLYDFYLKWDRERIPAEKARLLFFGTIRPYKGLDVLIEALGYLRGRLDFEATIAGEFYMDEAPFRSRVRSLGIEERIVWRSEYVAEVQVPELFRRADVVVLPYHDATQSGVIPLAYQFEVPVIASRVGGVGEVVRDGETGYLVPAGDPRALASSILEFFENRSEIDFRRNIGEFRGRLSWEQVVDKILALCRRPVDSTGGSGLLSDAGH